MRVVLWGAGGLVVLSAAASALLIASPETAAAPTCTKTLVTSGAWTTGTNWAPTGVPTASSYVCIPNGFTATLSTARTVDGVRIEGMLDGTGTLTISDTGTANPSELDGSVTDTSLALLAGELLVDTALMSGSGSLTVVSGASMSVTDADFDYGLELSGSRSLVNSGSVTLTGVSTTGNVPLYLNGPGVVVTSHGSMELAAGADIVGSGSLVNSATGSMTKTTGAATSEVTTVVENDGSMSSAVGMLVVDGGGTPGASTGSFGSAAAASTRVGGVVLGDGAKLLGPTAAGSGRVRIDGNQVTLASGATVAATGRTGFDGSVTGAGSLTVASGSMLVDTALMSGSGSLTVVSGASMSVTDADFDYGLELSGSRSLVNSGSVTLTGVSTTGNVPLYLNGPGVVVTSHGSMELAAGADIVGSGSLVNSATGSMTKTTGAATSEVTTVVENDGSMSSAVGMLVVDGGGTPGASTGSFGSAAAASTRVGGVVLGDGAKLLGPTAAGSGRVRIDGNQVTLASGATVAATGRTGFDGSVTGAGSLTVASGSMLVDTALMSGSGSLTVVSGASMSVTDADFDYGLELSGSRSLVNSGSVTLTGVSTTGNVPLYLNGPGVVVTSHGSMELAAGADIVGSGSLVNSATGSMTKTTGAATSEVTTVVENDGSMSSAVGMLVVDGGGTPGASTGSFGSAAAASTRVGGVVLGDGAKLLGPTAAGSGRVRIDGNQVTLASGATVAATGRTGFDGSVTGAGSLTVASGSMLVDTALMSGSGSLTVVSGASMSVTDADFDYGLELSGSRSLVNSGSVTLTGVSTTGNVPLYLNGPGVVVTSHGSMELAAGADIVGSGSLVNSATGSMTKTTGAATSEVTTVVENDGSMSSAVGMLVVDGGGTPGASTGSFGSAAAASTRVGGVVLGDGAKLLGPTAAGSGRVRIDGNQVTLASGATVAATGRTGFDGSVTGAGSLTVASGSMLVDTALMSGSGSLTVVSGASMSVTDADFDYGLELSGSRSLVNSGSVTLTGVSTTGNVPLYLNGPGVVVTSHGSMELAAGADIVGSGSLVNSATGTMTKTTGSDISTVEPRLDNFGTIRSLTGVFDFNGAFPAMTGGRVTRGTYVMVSPGAIELPGDVTRNDATMRLDGANAVLQDSASGDGLDNLTRIGPSGSLTLENGRQQAIGALTQEGEVVVGPGADSRLSAPSFTQTGGTTTLQVTESSLQTTGATNVSGGTLRGIGTVTAGGAGLSVQGTGRLAAGVNGVGTLSVAGDFAFTGTGTLAVDVNGTAIGTVDRVAVTGAAVTSGALDIDTGFTPALGDTARILTSTGTRTGTISSATGGDLPGDISWAAAYAPGSLTLKAARPKLSVADATKAEGNAGTAPLTFTVSQSQQLLAATTVTAQTENGTATSGGHAVGGGDYTATTLTVTVPLGATSATVSVPVAGDAVYEHTEDFELRLSGPGNATLADGDAVGTITNDESVPTLALAAATVIERDPGDSAASASVTATLSGVSAFATSAGWSTSNGTASAGDYTASLGTLNLAPGTTTASALVPVTGDLATEADETVLVSLTNGLPAGDVTLGAPATATILDDDAAVSVSPAWLVEPPTGTALITVPITLSHPNPRPVSLTWATADGTAVAPGDYTARGPTPITFQPGTTSRTVQVSVNADAIAEVDETFTVSLSSVVGGQAGTTTATMTIQPGCTKSGTVGDDLTLKGTPGNDVLCGLGGNDTFLPSGGNDVVYGGSPSGDAGVDTISYNVATCTGLVADLFHAEATSAGANCTGTTQIFGIENLTGSPNDDVLRGNGLDNTILGLAGDDSLLGDMGNDVLNGGAGLGDSASFVRNSLVEDPNHLPIQGVDANLTSGSATGAGADTMTAIEGLFGTQLKDTLTGNTAKNTLSGLGDDDILWGRAGEDILFGLEGADTMHGEAGLDRLFGGDDVDFLFGEDGSGDRLFGEGGFENVANFNGGAGTHDFCGQGSVEADGAVAGPGCENN